MNHRKQELQFFVVLIIMLALASLAACGEMKDEVWPYRPFRLNSGEVVQCRFDDRQACGVRLLDCSDGVRRYCLTNVEEL